ncbi:hypothetical protein QBC47DRAFT_5988 [Echria macrotheca]|uniref:Eisosome protein 1 n=1 Tax=Echria macrotheca TaxID=438768 RepID=A0AAJ0FG03_9PEZI|nr:hypothetical protein QBC47DRAFT_5988 [Echria macrotheca]
MGPTTLTQPPIPFRFDPATHSGRLKYANARDLPGFPSLGLKNDGAAATTAAALGWTNTKQPPDPAPDTSATASVAALLASDSRMASSGDSRRSTAGSQAATLAADSARRHRRNPSPPPSAWGSSAANLAFKSNLTAPPPVDNTSLARQGSMRAARGAMASSRPRAQSSPVPKESYPDQANAASNALSAAAIAHRPSIRTPTVPAEEGGAVPWTTMDRKMFTSHPPVQPEVDERKRNDVIHASALAMAKKMYTQQQSVVNTARADALARSSSFTRHGKAGAPEEGRPMQFDNLQEAAYRQAQERLAKLQQEHQRNRDLQEYYGTSGPSQRNALGAIRNKLTRRRSASDGALIEDKQMSQQIRKQMSLFDTKLAEVDEQKRARDRQTVLAAAQRNVQARLRDMDEKIQEENGWMKPSTKEDWEWKARAAAQARFDAARLEEQRKVDIGGGKLMDREAVDAIAAKRVQPLLDEINEKAELERERRLQQKADEEREKEKQERDRMREKEIQEIHKALKQQQKDKDKARKAEIKQEEKARKEEVKLEKARKEDAKASKIEQRRLSGDGKPKEQEIVPQGSTEETPTGEPNQGTATEPERTGGLSRALSINFTKRHTKQKSKDSTDKGPILDGETGNSPASKVKTWLKTRLARPRSQSNPVTDDQPAETGKKFIGGAALAKLAGQNHSSSTINERSSTSMREVALAGRSDVTSDKGPRGDERGEGSNVAATSPRTPSPMAADGDSASLDSLSVSSLSSVDRFEEARSTLNEEPVTPPQFVRAVPDKKQASPARGSRFSEILE